MLKDPRLEAMAPLVDWVEAHNARVVGGSGNEQAAAFALEMGLPGIAVSDAHSVIEVGVAYTALDGQPVDRRRVDGSPDQRLACARPCLVYRPDPHTDRQARQSRPGEQAGHHSPSGDAGASS